MATAVPNSSYYSRWYTGIPIATSTVIGLNMLEPSFHAKLKVHANRTDIINTVDFNGYTSYIGAESTFNNDYKLDIDDKFITLNSEKKFCVKLYKAYSV